MNRITFRGIALFAALLTAFGAGAALATQPGNAGAYPIKPVRIVVPFVAGGGTDTAARTIAMRMSAELGQQLVVDNRPGASGHIGMELTWAAAPDGYTIALISGSVVASATLQGKRVHALTDFTPIVQLTEQPYVLLVALKVPAKTVGELIELAGAKPGNLAYGSSGTGGMQHLSGILLAQQTNTDLLHVPYKGGGAVTADLIAGHIQMGFVNPLGARPYMDSGRVRALAVTSAKRSKAFPELPAISETVPGYEVSNWYGVVGPPKLPVAIVKIVNKAFIASLNAPDVRARLQHEGSDVIGGEPEALRRRISTEYERWSVVLRKAGITAN